MLCLEGQKLILADGTEFENSSCGFSEKRLWCYVNNYTSESAVLMAFMDKEKTSTITFQYGSHSDVYEGFTELRGFFIDEDEEMHIQLRQEVTSDA